MKKWMVRFFALFLSFSALGQKAQSPNNFNTLLWQISGNGLSQPSYLFGTIHMLCKEDAVLSDSLKKIIRNCKDVYLEVDMDNIFEMMGLLKSMKMRNDTTLSDLMDKKDYERVKTFFQEKSGLIPFSMLETYKPLLAVSTLAESSVPCESAVAMEQLIMEEAKRNNKNIKGLETMAYQAGIFDSIPYKIQAEQLIKYVDSSSVEKDQESKEFTELADAYKKQDLKRLEELSNKNDVGVSNFTDLLLYNRNKNWVEKLKTLLPAKSLLIAVGAGHLPGDKGVINLLRKAGYTVKPVRNLMTPVAREI
ncbi:MAG: TraB/GumN family protein [Bacteroidetes bacterium]|nr:TraB/GumN family protein [Bacteroidota bacterium]